MEFEFSLPRKPSIDAGRDAQQDREDLKAGIRTWSDIHAELGTDTETQAFRKAMDLVAMLRSKRLAEQMLLEETGEKIILPDSYMFQFTPNATAASSSTAAAEPGTEPTSEPGAEPGAEPAEPGELEAEGTGAGDDSGLEPGETQAGEEEIEKTDTDAQKDLLGAQT